MSLCGNERAKDRKARGLCPACGRTPKENCVSCQKCIIAAINRKVARKQKGFCPGCNGTPKKDRVCCSVCIRKACRRAYKYNQRKIMIAGLQVGRIVHYVTKDNKHLAAMIIDIYDKATGYVELSIILPSSEVSASERFVTRLCAGYDEENKTSYTWHYLEKI